MPTSPRARRLVARAAAVLVAACLAAASAPALCGVAWADAVYTDTDGDGVEDTWVHSDGGKTYEEVIESRESASSDDWDSEWIGGEKVPSMGVKNAMRCVVHTVYLGIESFVIALVGVADSVAAYITDTDSLTLALDDDGYASAYSLVLTVIEKVIEPVAMAFLMLALVLELLEYSKEVNQKNGDVGMWASYMWILVKYGAVATLLGHTELLMGAIYAAFLLVAQAMSALASAGGISVDAYDSIIVNMQEVTYADWGLIILYGVLAALLGIFSIALLVRVLVLAVTRMFEIYIMTAFSGFPLVAVVNRSTRESGMRYFRSFCGVCLQAGVLIFILAMSALMFGIITGLVDSMASDVGASGVFGALLTAIGPLAGLCGIWVLLGKSRELSDRIMGGA